jgi:hypothetical protein
MYVLLIVVCPLALFLLAIVLSVLLRFTDSDCSFGIILCVRQGNMVPFHLVRWNVVEREVNKGDALDNRKII